MMMIKIRLAFCFTLFWMVFGVGIPNSSWAASAEEINIRVQATLSQFTREVSGGDDFLKKAAGVLVFPSVLKIGLVFGGEYGEGALLVNQKTIHYYSTAAASFGLQAGVQTKAVVLVFMTQSALNHFRDSDGWEVGVDGSVAVVEWGVGKDITTINTSYPIVGFVFDNKGLMLNVTLEGAKFTKVVR